MFAESIRLRSDNSGIRSSFFAVVHKNNVVGCWTSLSHKRFVIEAVSLIFDGRFGVRLHVERCTTHSTQGLYLVLLLSLLVTPIRLEVAIRSKHRRRQQPSLVDN
jgi:hypothetical protein